MAKAEITTKDPAAFDPEVPLRQQGLDSLDMATFVFFVESELKLSIPHTEYERLASLNQITAALDRHGEEWAEKH